LPFGPATAVTDSSINAAITPRPAATAIASSPSRIVPAMSSIANRTLSGSGIVAPVSIVW